MTARVIGRPDKPVTLKVRDKQHARTRKSTVDSKTYSDNWDRIFNKDKKED